MTRYTLYGRHGWGSVLVEAQLEWYGLPFDFVEVPDLFQSEEGRMALAKVNPLAQVPTLVLPDGQVMTESAAITLDLADATGRADLVPAAGDAARPRFLRWLIFLVTNIYPTFTYADVPSRFVPGDEARKTFRTNVDRYAQNLWRMMEGTSGEPWFLGDRFSALDMFVSAMTRWKPRRQWFKLEAPKLFAAAVGADGLPLLRPVVRHPGPNRLQRPGNAGILQSL
jgi:GST-like protein